MTEVAWFAALCEGDCLRLEKLLDECGRDLVCLSPNESEASTVGFGWKGCNVLHVAVKQGWEHLVTKIVEVFDDGNPTDPLRWDDQRSSALPAVRKLPSKELKNLILAFDGNCKLDAIAIAVLNGDKRIVKILASALLKKCRSDPYDICLDESLPSSSLDLDPEDEQRAEQLRTTISAVLEELGEADRKSVLKHFEQSCEFNFLPVNDFLFHALCSYKSVLRQSRHRRYDRLRALQRCKTNIVSKTLAMKNGPELLTFLLDRKDSRGRTALHVAVDDNSVVSLLELIPGEKKGEFSGVLNARDRAGRTPLHRAASAIEYPDSVTSLIKDTRTDLNARFAFEVNAGDWAVDIIKVSQRNGFGKFSTSKEGATALHLAIYNPCGNQILSHLLMYGSSLTTTRREVSWVRCGPKSERYHYMPLGVAAIIGNLPVLTLLVEDDGPFGSDIGRRDYSHESPWRKLCTPVLHLAAAVKDSFAVETILASSRFDLTTASTDSRMVMHAAVQGLDNEVAAARKNLVDVVNFRDGWCKMESGWQHAGREDLKRFSHQACVNLLLHAGASMWSTDNLGKAPRPGPSCSPEFCSWWSERIEREIHELKLSMVTSANAVSVTAALVATASFMGPLQPPMGYGANDKMQIGEILVRIFIVLDSLAFYFALAAIVIASMISSLPVPNESVKIKRTRTRMSVILAVSLLILSIFCILVAFAASSIAIVQNDGRWSHSGLTTTTAAVGGFVCLCTIRWFLSRLVHSVRSLITSSGQYQSIGGCLAYHTHSLPLGCYISFMKVLHHSSVLPERFKARLGREIARERWILGKVFSRTKSPQQEEISA